MKRSELFLTTLALMLGGVGNAKAGLTITVNATSAPWEFVNGGLNTNFQWHESSGQPPAVLTPNPSAGIPLTPGDNLTISYVSGTWTNAPGNPFWDAGGDPTVASLVLQMRIIQVAYFLVIISRPRIFHTTDMIWMASLQIRLEA